MKRCIEGADRGQGKLFPVRLDEWIGEDHSNGRLRNEDQDR
jgi:hypothetical protein